MAMGGKDSCIIVDLATDDSESAVTLLHQVVRNITSDFLQSQHRHFEDEPLPENVPGEERQRQTQKQSHPKTNEHREDQQSRCQHIIVLSKHPLDEPVFHQSRVIVADDCMELLFLAKTSLDETPGYDSDVQVVTTIVMKKFWEAACLHMLSTLTTWSVRGVEVHDQEVSLQPPIDLGDVEIRVKDFLQSVGNPDEVTIWRSSAIPHSVFNAGFHDRHGGVSKFGSLATMNMVYSDRKPDSILMVQENRRRLALQAGFDPALMHVTKAEHGCTIWVIGRPEPARYDGITTDQPGVTVCAAGADCCMILLADTRIGAVGAVHSGWLGTTLGAVRSLLHTMTREFGTVPADIRATIGPSLGPDRFFLTEEAARPITDLDPNLTRPSSGRPGHVHVDLARANVAMLVQAGVPEAHVDTDFAMCTFDNQRFFSHRRDGIPFGNQVGFISRRSSPEQRQCQIT